MRYTNKTGSTVGKRAGGLAIDRINGTLRVAPPGSVLLFFDATKNKLRFVDEEGNLTTLKAGGGGVSAHPDLTGLSWTSSGHTGSGLAGFSGAGAAGNVSVSTGLSLAAGSLAVDTTTISTKTFASSEAAAAQAAAESTAASLADAAEAAAIAVSQPLDADLTALAALSSTGALVRTGSNTYALRTLSGGSGVTIANGDGVSGNPTISFAGGTGQDDDPTTAYTISITPSNATLFSRDGGITVRSASAGNLSTRRATNLTGAFADFYTTNMNVFQTRWSYSGSASIRVRWVTGSSVAATCRYKFGWTGGGLTSTDAETALRDTVMFRYVTGLGHTKWMAYSQNASGSEETDTGITVSANTEYLLEIQLNATQAVFYINGTSVATHSTYKPSTSQDLGFQGGVYATGKTIYVVGSRFNLTWS